MKPLMNRLIKLLSASFINFVALILLSALSVFGQTGAATATATSPILGNPSDATADTANENNYLVAHTDFILS